MKKSLTLAFAVALSTLALAQPPQQIDIHNLPGGAKVVEDVIVPVPNEIFGVLDRIGKPAWHEVLRTTKGVKTPASRYHTALLLGTIIAEGFVAVEDQNAEEVKNIGRLVLQLSTAINVKNAVQPRSNAIIQGADQGDWKSVRLELDKAQRDVQTAMKELNDEQLSQLVSLGGWLRGTEALTTVVKQKYSVDGAELLHQPLLAEHFVRRINGFAPRMKSDLLVQKMKGGLEKILPLMGKDDQVIPEAAVEEMKSISERLIKEIHP